jgi:hypothetical protein
VRLSDLRFTDFNCKKKARWSIIASLPILGVVVVAGGVRREVKACIPELDRNRTSKNCLAFSSLVPQFAAFPI